MKRCLANVLRVLVSVGILAYLGLRILQDETESALAPLADGGPPAVASLATTLAVSEAQLERVQTTGLVPDPQTPGQLVVDLGRLPWRERAPLVCTVGPQRLHHAFGQIRFIWFLMAVASMGVVVFLGIVRWQWILRVQGLELPFWRVCSINFIGLFFNAFMLGATGGDVMKAWYVAHETHHKKAEAVATVIVDRIIGLLVLFVIALAMMLLFWHRVFDDPRLRTFTVFTLLVVVGTIGITVVGLWKGFADRFPGMRRALQKLPKYDTLRRMVDAYRVYTSHPGVLARTALVTVGVHVFSMLSIVCVGSGLGIHQATLVDYFLYLPIINCISAVPISISGFGVREGMYVAMFSRLGVPGAAALALSLLGYFAVLLWSVVGAGFYLTHRRELPSAGTLAEER